jgi:hypothetical protein
MLPVFERNPFALHVHYGKQVCSKLTFEIKWPPSMCLLNSKRDITLPSTGLGKGQIQAMRQPRLVGIKSALGFKKN